MSQFWLGLCEIAPPVTQPESTAGQPLLAPNRRSFAIEVIYDEGQYAVLFSVVNAPYKPGKPSKPSGLECLIGFASGAKACSIWGDRGFPLVDATIECNDKTLTVISPFFVEAAGSMRYSDALFTLDGLDFKKGKAPPDGLPSEYRQFQDAPDDGLPATYIQRRCVIWRPQRNSVHDWGPQRLALTVQASRYPGLMPFETGALKLNRVWTGTIDLALRPSFPDEAQRVARAAVFGAPAFRFEDVEVLGFRVDLAALGADTGAELAKLVGPLNFHLEPGTLSSEKAGELPTDFEYRAATATLVIELLRYGKMKLRTPMPPLGAADYQSQHELVVRVLVGRCDDDTAQAHSPAIYVPAIFVDNPWSKVVGRELQGFDKWMAAFCASQGDELVCLLPDGRMPPNPSAQPSTIARQLAEISAIRLLDRPDSRTGGTRILDIDCAPDRFSNWDAFEKIDLELAMGSTSLAGLRWRQSDFEATEFRRSFARSASFRTLRGFRSIQVSPVGERKLARTWISGTFLVDDDLSIVRPGGVAALTLHYSKDTPQGWQQLCKVLGIDQTDGEQRVISFPTGSWYRLRCAMDFRIDNGLEWGESQTAA